jgi:hypothetical protein
MGGLQGFNTTYVACLIGRNKVALSGQQALLGLDLSPSTHNVATLVLVPPESQSLTDTEAC